MNQRDRQVGILTAAGFTADEVAKKLGVSTATVDRARALQDVQALVALKSAAGLSPRDVLDSLLYSTNDQTRMKTAVELTKLPESDESDLPPPLQEGVKRVTVEDHLGTTTTRVYPLPPFSDGDDDGPVPRPDGCVWSGSDGPGPENCGCTACRAARDE